MTDHTPELPDYNKLVIARLEGANHHTGDFPAWHREGWAFMVRWDTEEHTVADGWSRKRYDIALGQIDADYATVKEWLYVSDLLRAQACVNACAGIPTKQLGEVKALVEAAQFACDHDNLSASFSRLDAALAPFRKD